MGRESKLKRAHWYIILIFVMAVWGTFHPAVRYLRYMSQPLLAMLREAVASVVILAVLILSRKKLNFSKRDIIPLVFIGILGGYIPPLFSNLGTQSTSAILGSILVNTNPIFVALLSIFLIRERVSLKKAFFIVLGFIGMVIVVTGVSDIRLDITMYYYLGALFSVIAAGSIALNTIYNKRIVKKYGGLKATAVTVMVGFLFLFIHNLMNGDISQVTQLSLFELGLITYIGIFPTAVTWLLFLTSLNYLPASDAAVFKLLIPVFATIFAVIFLGEVLTLNLIIGGILVLFSVYLVQKTD